MIGSMNCTSFKSAGCGGGNALCYDPEGTGCGGSGHVVGFFARQSSAYITIGPRISGTSLTVHSSGAYTISSPDWNDGPIRPLETSHTTGPIERTYSIGSSTSTATSAITTTAPPPRFVGLSSMGPDCSRRGGAIQRASLRRRLTTRTTTNPRMKSNSSATPPASKGMVKSTAMV